MLQGATLAVAGGTGSAAASSAAAPDSDGSKRIYRQKFPTLFAPLYGEATRETIVRPLGPNVFALE